MSGTLLFIKYSFKIDKFSSQYNTKSKIEMYKTANRCLLNFVLSRSSPLYLSIKKYQRFYT